MERKALPRSTGVSVLCCLPALPCSLPIPNLAITSNHTKGRLGAGFKLSFIQLHSHLVLKQGVLSAFGGGCPSSGQCRPGGPCLGGWLGGC